MANIGGGRVLRVCDLCGGVDDHPRHVLAGGEEGTHKGVTAEIVRKVMAASPQEHADRLLTELLDTSSQDRHLDCCAAAGCPTGTCEPQVADAPGTGRRMLDHVAGLDIDRMFVARDDVVTGDAK